MLSLLILSPTALWSLFSLCRWRHLYAWICAGVPLILWSLILALYPQPQVEVWGPLCWSWDAVSGLFISLTVLLVTIVSLSSTRSSRAFWGWIFLLESLLILLFLARDGLSFFLGFEGVLIPLCALIAIWGGTNKYQAAWTLFLYTFIGTLGLWISSAFLYAHTGSFLWSVWHGYSASPWLWWGIFFACAVKLPLWPFHSWLPIVHVAAPTQGSMLLAGIVLKVGGYGLFRLMTDMLAISPPDMGRFVIQISSLIAIFYGSLCAWGQNDLKRLVAYASVSHMGLVMLGLMANSPLSTTGSLFLMISHGLISAGLFWGVSRIQTLYGTRDLREVSGLISASPRLTGILFLFIIGLIAVPGTMGFIGEFLIIYGLWSHAPWISLCAAGGMVGSALYGLRFCQCFWGKTPNLSSHRPIFPGRWVLALLGLSILGLGLFPHILLQWIP